MLSTRVVNPRFPKLSDEQFELFLNELKGNIKDQLGIQADFLFDVNYSIKEFFSYREKFIGGREALLRQYMKKYNLKSVENIEDLYQRLKWDFELPSNHLDYADLLTLVAESTNENHTDLSGKFKTVDALLKEIARIHFEKFRELEKIPVEDGQPLLLKEGFNEFPEWAAYLREEPLEGFILTNQPLISFKEPTAAIHSSLRGGITAGFSLDNKSQYGSVVVMSTFPFLFQNELLDEMRDFEPTSGMMPAYLAAYTTHEFGHSFAYWGHYFEKGCIMNPAAALKIKKWYEETRNKENCTANYREDYRAAFMAPFEER